MQYDFDTPVNRRGTGSSKWDNVGPRIGNPDALPMWVADTDFPCPQPIADAVRKRAEHTLYGYAYQTPDFREAVVSWLARRHGWNIRPDWIVYLPGVVPVFNLMIQEFTCQGDPVIIQRPVYHPFTHTVEDNERVVSSNSLAYRDGKYVMDFDDLERRAADPAAKLMFLCNPHNPVGRCFTREELLRVAAICQKHNVILVSDEIHSDLIYPGHTHIPIASLSEEIGQNTVTALAPSKTFNIPGLRCSAIVIPNGALRARFEKRIAKNRISLLGTFSIPACVAAYTQCDDYLEQLIQYLDGNVACLADALEKRMPKIKLIRPESTYLMWMDCTELGMDADALADFFINRCLVAVNRGDMFGPEGAGFARLNIACPRSTLEQALSQIEAAYQKL